MVEAVTRMKPLLCATALVALAGHVTAGVPRLVPIGTKAPALQPALAFEAASVKVNRSGSPQGSERITPGGRFTTTNLSLQFLIRLAYERSPRSRGLEPFEVTGGPDWLEKDRFDITATAGREVSLAELRSMLRTLLIDRFKLQVHYDTQQGPVFRLVMARQNALGPQLRRTSGDCTREPLDPLRGIAPGVSEPCGYFGPSPTVPMGSDRAFQAIRGLTMEDFALRLYPYLGRRVIDGTGLSGYFDAEFEFTAEIVMPPPPPGQPNLYDGRVLPSIFSVLPDQLGLKLESQRGPVEILVVDHAERPAPD